MLVISSLLRINLVINNHLPSCYIIVITYAIGGQIALLVVILKSLIQLKIKHANTEFFCDRSAFSTEMSIEKERFFERIFFKFLLYNCI